MSGYKSLAKSLAKTAALGFLLIAVAQPASAAPRTMPSQNSSQEWRNARAQVMPDSAGMPTGERAAAIHDCSGKVATMHESTWGDEEIQKYRACMSEHGQVE